MEAGKRGAAINLKSLRANRRCNACGFRSSVRTEKSYLGMGISYFFRRS
jgi:hypothetical protein